MKNGGLVLSDVETGEIIQHIGESADISDTGWMVSVVLLRPDGRTALVARTTGTIHLWDLETGQEVRRFDTGPVFVAEADYVNLSQDGNLALVSGTEGATLWDVQTGAQLAFIPGNIFNEALAADGRTALLGYGDGSMREVALINGAQVARFGVTGLRSGLPALALSPDGNSYLACIEENVLEDGTSVCQVALFDAATGTEIRRFGPENTYVDWIAFSPDGHRAI